MDNQRLLFILLVLALIGGVYYYYQASSTVVVPNGGVPMIAELEARLADIRPLSAVVLDTSVFSNPFFHSLTLMPATSGTPVTAGRLNPFLPF